MRKVPTRASFSSRNTKLLQKMKKQLLTVLATLACAASAFSYDFCIGQPSDSAADLNVTWSKYKWHSDIFNDTPVLPNKPGPRDGVAVRWGRYVVNIDQDINLTKIGFGSANTIIARDKKIIIKKKFDMGQSDQKAVTTIDFTKCKAEFGSLNLPVWTKSNSLGRTELRLTDTVLNVKGGFTFLLPIGDQFKNNSKVGGPVFTLIGKSALTFGGNIMLDSLLWERADQFLFEINLEERDGNLPVLSFDKKADLRGCDFSVKLSKLPAKGKYGLIEFKDKKSGINNPSSFKVNGSKYKFGDKIKVGENSCIIYIGASRVNPAAKNCLVLEVL